MLCIACNAVEVESVSTSVPSFVTATLPATNAPQPTVTALPPSPVPTNSPVQGTTTTQVNVRSQTNTASESLGVIPAFSPIQIIGKESSGNWYKVIFEIEVGWVRAEFVQVDTSVEIQTVWIESDSPTGRSGVVISGINVRNGAGTQFESIGVLTPKDVVVITGKDTNNAWVQIKFVGEVGWVSTEFLQIENINEIPIVGVPPTQNVEITPIVEATTSSPFQIAQSDNDSIQVPLFNLVLEDTTFQITGDVSSPNGDTEDWIQISSIQDKIFIEISCTTNELQLELRQAENVLEQFTNICGKSLLFNVSVNQNYALQIFQANSNEPQYTKYLLKIKGSDY